MAKKIIDAILDYTKQQQKEIAAHMEEQKPIFSASNFFTNGESDGITSKDALLQYLFAAGESGLQSFQQFLSDIKQKVKLEISMFPRTDKKGIQYFWVSQRSTTTTRGYKLMYFDGIDRLIAAYQFSLYRFELTLEELFEEAKKG